MILLARLALAGGLVFALAGCLTTHPTAAPTSPGPPFRVEAFFEGPTRGEGTLQIRGRAPQAVRVQSSGRAEGDAFRLDQTITIGEEPPVTRTWHLRPDAAGRYTATLTDADGPVVARTEGNVLFIRYALRRPFMTMEQRLTLAPDGHSAQNLATVRVFGIPWARLTERIERVGGAGS